jgi:WD40 repeat protein/tRNA A-37 threonylcarbamoyl transferase component Bud32
MRVADDLGVGTVLAGFRVESLLGHGGMSTVYMAEDLRLKRRVALKVMAADLAADEAFHERFLRESELAASIDHPHIVPIYEAGECDDVLFIAMRYVAGGDLKERLRHGRMESGEAMALLVQVASALDAAHSRGLVHRDVKPSNVLLDTGTGPDGSDHVYLADFGLTKRLADHTGVGDGGHLVGTIDYVAPEQIAGDEVDGRVDVYSLGCVLYECLVGEPPFRRDTDVAVVFAHLDADPPAPSAHRADLPAALDAVITTALAKEPEQRFSSCGELTRAALAVAVDEASRRLADVASRAAAGRSELSDVEAELAGTVVELQVVRARARALSGISTPTRVATQGVCPFKGLASFEPVDAEYFFGRERLIAELVARLVGVTFLGIVGPSGSGKSSVLRAGLVPALAGGVLPGSERWRRVMIRPGERPFEELRRMFASGAEDPLGEALGALTADERVLLVVDQLEELFTACNSDEERARFVDVLARAAAEPDGRAIVVVALRADFYGRVAAYPSLAERLGANHVLVAPMQASELRRAVELPAGRVGLRVEPDLADTLVADVEGEPGALPLLSTSLLELWQKRHGDTLSLSSYHETGGVQGAVARLAEATYARVPAERRPLVRAIMLRLVGEGEVDAAVRRRAPLAELDLERNEDVASVLATLADGRLVTVSEGSVEVAHEALLREWPRLREWIQDDTEGRRLRRHITQAATDWDRAGRDPSELYRGARLAAALDWATDDGFELNAVEREFVANSRDAAEEEAKRARRTNRRLRGLLGAVAILLAASVVGGILAVLQRSEARHVADQARDAETAQFAQRLGAQALVEEDLDLSLLLARQAVAIEDTPQTRASLLAALVKAPAAIGIMHGEDDAYLQHAALSPDGSTLAVVDFYNKLLFFDARTYQPIGEPLSVSTWLDSVAFSPDGKLLAYGGGPHGGGFVGLIDARTRAQLAEASVGGRPTNMAFTNDGSQLVVVVAPEGRAPSISIRDAATLDPVGPPIVLDGFRPCRISLSCRPTHFALTPDGRSVLTASDRGELEWWDLVSRQKTRTLPIAPGQEALALSPDGRLAAVGTEEGIQLIEVRTGDVTTATGGFTESPNWLWFSPDGASVASANVDGTVTLWDVASATRRHTLHGHADLVLQGLFSPDGTTLYTVSGDGTAIAWDLAGTRSIRRPFTFTGERDSGNYPGRFSPDGRLIAVGLEQQGIALWDTSDLTPVGGPLMETGGEVKALAFSPDGHTLAAAAVNGDVTVWDLASRSLRYEPIRTPSGFLAGLAFSPDGTMLVTSGYTGVRLWDVATGASLGGFAEQAIASDLALSADGTLAAFALYAGSGAQVWDVADRSLVAAVEGDREADEFSVALSPDGRTLAVGGYGRFVRLWDVGTRALLHEPDQGADWMTSLEFSPDGRYLVAGGTLWDVVTGTQMGPRLTAGPRAPMMDLSSDGRHLLATATDGRGAVWDVDPESWAQRACTLANRTLSRDEWETFLPGRPYEPACAS